MSQEILPQAPAKTTTKIRLGRQALHASMGLVAFQLANFLSTWLITNTYGVIAQGRYQLFVTIGILIVSFSQLGLAEAVAYMVPKWAELTPQKVRGMARYVVVQCLVIGVIVGGGLALASGPIAEHLVSLPNFGPELRWVALFIPGQMVLMIAAAILRGQNRAGERTLVSYYIVGWGYMLVILLAWWVGMGSDSLYWARVVVVMLAAVLAVLLVWKALPKPSVQNQTSLFAREDRRELWRFGGLMTFVALSQYVVTQPLFDLLAVGHVADETAVGVYAVCVKLGSLVAIAGNSLGFVMGPAFAAAIAARDEATVRNRYQRGWNWMALFSLLLAGGIYLAGTDGLAIFGKESVEGWPILQIILLGSAVRGLLGPNSNLLLAYGHIKQQFAYTLAGAVSYGILLVILGKMWNVEGVAVATSISLAGLEAARFWAVRRMYPWLGMSPEFPKILASALAAFASGWACKAALPHGLMFSFASGLTFAIVTLALAWFFGVSVPGLKARKRAS